MRYIAIAVIAIMLIQAIHAVGAPAEQTGPQPPLPTETISITTSDRTSHQFKVELPTTPAEQSTGLMFRKSIPPNTGMLFVFGTPNILNFWMKNCPVPEDMLFLDQSGKIEVIAKNTTPYSLAFISSTVPASATLELQGGITDQLNITAGERVIAPQLQGNP